MHQEQREVGEREGHQQRVDPVQHPAVAEDDGAADLGPEGPLDEAAGQVGPDARGDLRIVEWKKKAFCSRWLNLISSTASLRGMMIS